VPDDKEGEHRAYVIGAVFASVAALEASINELYHEAINGEPKTADGFECGTQVIKSEWVKMERRSPILAKYERALRLAGQPSFEGETTWQDAADLILLRNTLVHYKAEWHDERGAHHRLQQRLDGKFILNVRPPGFNLWFPHQCLSAGCAEWATRTVQAFMAAFCKRIGIANRF
jgi:hypothetical protein